MRQWSLPSMLFVAVVAAVCVAFPGGTASAQTPGMLLGRVVVEGDGAPVGGATVTLEHNDSDRRLTLVADSQGRFGHLGVRPGFYTVVVERDGFAAVEIRGVEIRAGDRVRLWVEATRADEAPFSRRIIRYRRPLINIEDGTLTTRVL